MYFECCALASCASFFRLPPNGMNKWLVQDHNRICLNSGTLSRIGGPNRVEASHDLLPILHFLQETIDLMKVCSG
jgi:hypothetical protein